MTINPKDYDLDELRKMARERGGATIPVGDEDVEEEAPTPGFDTGGGGLGGDVLGDGDYRSQLYRQLLPLESMVGGELEKPYLHGLPESYAGELIVFEWLSFLLEKAGFRGANEAVDYYAQVGWITEDVSDDLEDYLLGLEGTGSDHSELSIDDHLLSLVHIAKLTSMQ
ncbi:flagella E [Halorhabdus sp. CBA1104]|uniref:FlaD/FlaE family flagellar protein n=1 Tax=Halorhabdus sp. CBA1104 TaxID=1380432 RepID=UPI0012B1FD13|nr:FlaD/FlaE family flagellar protein [Halorhabdus sp. CBA1104]QGN07530.1 flagella E [Halorhabdus sp. CBA1104]